MDEEIKDSSSEERSESSDNGSTQEEDFLHYLDEVGLKKYFPRKLTKKQATEVRLFQNDVSEIDRENLPFLFISKLTSLDSKIFRKDNFNIRGSLRDFIFAILHCSDDQLRQHLMEKINNCQRAVTVLLPGVQEDDNPQLLLWALRGIWKKWKESETDIGLDKRMVSEPVFTAAFIRFGDTPISKSVVLNNIFGRARGNETLPYFLSYEEERENVYHMCGSVEAQWYQPMYARKDELLKKVTLMLNLRGDSDEFVTQRNFICRVANAVFIFVDVSNEETFKAAIDEVKDSIHHVFVIYLQVPKGPKVRQKGMKYCTSKTRISKTKGRIDGIEFSVEHSEIELSKIICSEIVNVCKNLTREEYRSIDTWRHLCRKDVNIDLDNEIYKRTTEFIEKYFSINETVVENKNLWFPLQTKWQEWVVSDKKPINLNDKRSVTDLFKEKQDNMRKIRKSQQIQGFSKKVQELFDKLQDISKEDRSDTLHYFITQFQTQLEKKTSVEISQIVNEIDKLRTSLQTRKSEMRNASSLKWCEEEKQVHKLEEKLLLEIKYFNDKNISWDHFIREFGQLYEACLTKENPQVKERNKLILNIGATFLLHGYPLEILNGGNDYIPMQWISDVLIAGLSKHISDPKIFVLSIIGNEGGGLSTLLNNMFGTSFSVRPSMYTSGIYLQLLEVSDETKKNVGFQYLLIIDIKGFPSPDQTDLSRDYLIATLAMCIGNLTLLNIAQETIGTNMLRILEKVVRVLIRKKKVRLASRCRIIQQMFNDLPDSNTNKVNMTKIKDALNNITRIAAAEEKADDINTFADVFPLVEDDDFQFLPYLWKGLISSPNAGYNTKVNDLKAVVLETETSEKHRTFTMLQFMSRFKKVWEAVKSENFAFHFQSRFDTVSKQRSQLHHSILIGKMRTEITEWELRNGNELTNSREESLRNLKKKITSQCLTVNEQIDKYDRAHTSTGEEIRHHDGMMKETFDVGEDIENTIKCSTEILLKTKKGPHYLPHYIIQARKELEIAVHTTASEIYNRDSETIESKFRELWGYKTKCLKENFSKKTISERAIDETCDEILKSLLRDNNYTENECNDAIKERYGDSSWFRRFRSVFGPRIGSKYKENRVQSEIDDIVREHTNDIEKQKQIQPFQQKHINDVLMAVYDKLKVRKISKEHVPFLLARSLKTVAEVCKACNVQYQKSNSLEAVLKKEKLFLRSMFLGVLDEEYNCEAAVQLTYSKLISAAKDHILNYFNITLLNEMRKTNYYNNKEMMTGVILEELCFNNDPALYRDFILKNGEFVNDWLRQKVSAQITENCWGSSVISRKVDTMLRRIEVALLETNTSFAEKPKMTPTFKDWAREFLDNENMIYNALNVEFSQTDIDFNIKDITVFTDKQLKVFREHFEADVFDELYVSGLGDIKSAKALCSDMKKDVALEIVAHLEVCDKACPFCGVRCHIQLSDEHKHTAVSHYPLGLVGCVDNKTNALTTATCLMLVASDQTYQVDDETSKYFRDYQWDYPNWDITPIDNDDPIDYWKWVLKTFNSYFSNEYHLKAARIPKEWQTVTNIEAIRSVRRHYKLSY